MRRLVLSISVLALLVWALALAPKGFFSGDSGVKFVQSHALWESGFTSRTLPYDHAFDPDEEFFPYRKQVFTRVVDGERQGIYSIVFTAAAAPLIGAIGWHGLPILPVLGGILILLALFLLSRRLALPWPVTAAVMAVTVFATPLLLYSVQFTEHSLVVGLTTLALALLTPGGRYRPFWAGILAGLAGTLRPEAYCAVSAIGLALLLLPDLDRRQRLRHGLYFGVGALSVLLVYWGGNVATAGTWDPIMAGNAAGNVEIQPGALIMLVGHIGNWSVLLWALPFVVVAVAGCIPKSLFGERVRLALWIAAAILLCLTAARAQQLASGRTLAGLFTVTPLAALGLLKGPTSARTRHLWVFAVAFVAQVLILDSTGNGGGLQLGARYLLPALPPLLLLVAVVLQEPVRELMAKKPWRGPSALLATGVILLGLSVWAMMVGIRAPHSTARNSELDARVLSSMKEELVITQGWWHAQALAAATLEGKRLYYAPQTLRDALDRAVERGYREAVVVAPKPVNLLLSNGYWARTVGAQRGWFVFQRVSMSQDPE